MRVMASQITGNSTVFFNSLLRLMLKKTAKLCITGPFVRGDRSPHKGPVNAASVSVSWRHRENIACDPSHSTNNFPSWFKLVGNLDYGGKIVYKMNPRERWVRYRQHIIIVKCMASAQGMGRPDRIMALTILRVRCPLRAFVTYILKWHTFWSRYSIQFPNHSTCFTIFSSIDLHGIRASIH